MENKLKQLFDYQKFAKNEKIEKWVKELETKYEPELLTDDSLVFAVGGKQDSNNQEKNTEGDKK